MHLLGSSLGGGNGGGAAARAEVPRKITLGWYLARLSLDFPTVKAITITSVCN